VSSDSEAAVKVAQLGKHTSYFDIALHSGISTVVLSIDYTWQVV